LQADFLRLLPERPRPIAIQRWSLRRVGLMVLTLLVGLIVVQQAWGLLLDDEGVSDAPIRSANLACAAPEPLVLMAQSVPTAAMVPCVDALPTGWSLGDVVVGKGRSWFALDHDRGGMRAIIVELTGSCDAGSAKRQASDQPGTQLLQRVERTSPGAAITRWYAFPGGCITQRLDASTGRSSELLNDASITMGFISRDALRINLRHESGGRLELDEKTAR
jgi:hypothetical protein